MPSALAVGATFVFYGAIHDVATMAVRGSAAFLFTPWLSLLSVGAWTGCVARPDLAAQPWIVRAAINVSCLSACLAIALAICHFVA